jgi:6-phosphogluconolactonase
MISARPYRWTGLCNPILFCMSLAILSFGTPLLAQILYAPGGGSLSEYAINPTIGALTPPLGSPLQGPFSAGVALDPLNRFFYLANPVSNSIWGYAISNNGALLPLLGSPYPSPAPQTMLVDPTGKFVYVAGTNASGDTIISGYTIEHATGALTVIAGSPAASEPV